MSFLLASLTISAHRTHLSQVTFMRWYGCTQTVCSSPASSPAAHGFHSADSQSDWHVATAAKACPPPPATLFAGAAPMQTLFLPQWKYEQGWSDFTAMLSATCVEVAGLERFCTPRKFEVIFRGKALKAKLEGCAVLAA